MQKLFQTGYAFFLVAVVSLIVSLLTERFAVLLSLAVVFFVIGLAVRRKNYKKSSQEEPKT